MPNQYDEVKIKITLDTEGAKKQIEELQAAMRRQTGSRPQLTSGGRTPSGGAQRGFGGPVPLISMYEPPPTGREGPVPLISDYEPPSNKPAGYVEPGPPRWPKGRRQPPFVTGKEVKFDDDGSRVTAASVASQRIPRQAATHSVLKDLNVNWGSIWRAIDGKILAMGRNTRIGAALESVGSRVGMSAAGSAGLARAAGWIYAAKEITKGLPVVAAGLEGLGIPGASAIAQGTTVAANVVNTIEANLAAISGGFNATQDIAKTTLRLGGTINSGDDVMKVFAFNRNKLALEGELRAKVELDFDKTMAESIGKSVKYAINR